MLQVSLACHAARQRRLAVSAGYVRTQDRPSVRSRDTLPILPDSTHFAQWMMPPCKPYTRPAGNFPTTIMQWAVCGDANTARCLASLQIIEHIRIFSLAKPHGKLFIPNPDPMPHRSCTLQLQLDCRQFPTANKLTARSSHLLLVFTSTDSLGFGPRQHS
jgi:hypothetical protein